MAADRRRTALLAAPSGPADSLRAQTALRRTAEPARVAAALTQAELRIKGAREVRRPRRPDVLHARRARAGHPAPGRRAPGGPAGRVLGATTVIDLGCGIGGDLIAVARAGLTCAGVDLDPVRVEVARANLDALGLAGAVAVADATTVDPSPFDVAFADPARRSARGRTFDVDDWTPPWSFVESLLTGDACVKIAPGIPHDLVPARRRGRVGQRPRRGQGGRAVGRPARHRRPPRDGDRATAAWPR